MEAIARSDSPVNRSTGVIQQSEWSAVDVDAAQFKGAQPGSHAPWGAPGGAPMVDLPDFAVLVPTNGSVFEMGAALLHMRLGCALSRG
jgi:hypothetical protein